MIPTDRLINTQEVFSFAVGCNVDMIDKALCAMVAGSTNSVARWTITSLSLAAVAFTKRAYLEELLETCILCVF